MTPLLRPTYRKIHWENVKGARAHAAFWIGTGFGAGLSPFAPGTAGTALAIPIVYFTWHWDLAARLLLWGAILAIGTWASQVFDEVMGSGDHQSIVIDEVVGYGVTAWTLGPHWPELIFAFLLFRVLDVVKPPPVRQLDSWSKKKALSHRGFWSGFGVMADDLLAALMGLAVVYALQVSGYFR